MSDCEDECDIWAEPEFLAALVAGIVSIIVAIITVFYASSAYSKRAYKVVFNGCCRCYMASEIEEDDHDDKTTEERVQDANKEVEMAQLHTQISDLQRDVLEKELRITKLTQQLRSVRRSGSPHNSPRGSR